MAVFNVDYEDARQLAFSVGASQETRFFNAAEVNVKGIEVEATYAPASVPGLDVMANFSQDGTIDKFEADSNFDGTIQAGERYTGRPLTRTPEISYGVQSITHMICYQVMKVWPHSDSIMKMSKSLLIQMLAVSLIPNWTRKH